MNSRNRRRVGRKRFFVAALASVIILLLLGWKAGIRLEALLDQMRRVHWPTLTAAFVYSAGWHIFVGAHKWWSILRALGVDVGYWEVFRVRWGSDPIRFAAPVKTGELVNAFYFAKRDGLGFGRAAGSIVFDKSLNLFGTVFWLYVGTAAMAALPAIGYLGLHTAMGLAVLVVLGVPRVRRAAVAAAGWLHPKIGRLAKGVLSAFDEFSPLQKFGFLAYGVVFQLRPIVVCGLLFMAFQPNHVPSAQELLALGSIVVLMSNIPSLGGIGPREATLMTLFAAYADQTTLLGIGLLMSFSMQLLPAILGIPLMFPLLRAMTPDAGETSQGEASEPAPAERRAAIVSDPVE